MTKKLPKIKILKAEKLNISQPQGKSDAQKIIDRRRFLMRELKKIEQAAKLQSR